MSYAVNDWRVSSEPPARPNTWLTGCEALSARIAPREPTVKSCRIAIPVADGFDRAQVNGIRATPLKAGIAKRGAVVGDGKSKGHPADHHYDAHISIDIDIDVAFNNLSQAIVSSPSRPPLCALRFHLHKANTTTHSLRFHLHGPNTTASTDSQYSHIAWATSRRKQGGLGPDLKLLLVAHRDMSVSPDYSILIEDEGIALRGLFIIDP
ncbi:uncharacterized protein BXZ73DRAFT_98702 [Epithele typhae]|uniref:uncharacterized protein n=1 Tax=Epithele typhae TaxID=378194 RepID=UPI0020079609|nr:uncharacterized protein BXZ73DRAFT_98702 [Epithele typhae]KAH9940870.1 hypothetical protein BXZ73DRAFT_98702 [Epithele typhae]